MRQLVYSVATSLDGFIAGPKDEYDWIIQDPTIDFSEVFRQFDTIVMGRRCYEFMLREGRSPKEFGMKAYVASTTLDAAQHPDVTIISSDLSKAVVELKKKSGKDIWLFGGGSTFRGLLDAGVVDRVELSVIPVLLGGGIPLVPEGRRWPLRLKDSRTFPSGIVSLTYYVATEPQL
ncbi:dihydrofolate reductase family protein [Telmatobacter sp. DSM 110680]|uniref:Dihydrofolate reductase family protein n=1 Tax=Telmatobacter sp. DSM 110680 TaxID=3036704 RepID=A0AAU7DHS1_9BACT